MAEYYNVTTNQGDVEVANAITNGTKIQITHIAFGDGNGSVPTPTKSRTTLVREVHRQAVTKYERHATNPNWIVIETIIPSNVGGFTIREMGIIGNGKLISHGSHAPYEKVADLTGVSEYRLKFTQNVTDGNVVSMTLDDSLIYATQAWIDENYVPRDEIVDDLTTDDATKPVSAKQAKILQDNKLDANKRGATGGVASLDENKKVPVIELPIATSMNAGVIKLVNDLITGGTDAAITAEQIKLFFAMFAGGNNHFRIPNPLEPSKPFIFQFFDASSGLDGSMSYTFPVAFPNVCKSVKSSAYVLQVSNSYQFTTQLNPPSRTGGTGKIFQNGTGANTVTTIIWAIGY